MPSHPSTVVGRPWATIWLLRLTMCGGTATSTVRRRRTRTILPWRRTVTQTSIRRRAVRTRQRVTVIRCVRAFSCTRTGLPFTVPVTQCAGIRTTSCRRWQRSLSTSLSNPIAAIAGVPIFIANDSVAEVPCTPLGSTALFCA